MNRSMHSCFAFLVAFAAPQELRAESPPPTPFDAIASKATMAKEPSKGMFIGSFHVQLERTTLNDVLRELGVGMIGHQGDASESEDWLCYTNLTSKRTERIWLISNAEMGGPEQHITGISAEVSPGSGPTMDCPALPENMRSPSLDNGLWLGSSSRAARAAVGDSSQELGTWRSYDFQATAPGNCSPNGFDVTNWLLLRFRSGRINALQSGQETTC